MCNFNKLFIFLQITLLLFTENGTMFLMKVYHYGNCHLQQPMMMYEYLNI